MIHELLAALSGASGDIITVQKGLDPYDLQLEVFAVSPTISFVSSSERVAINRLVKTGYTFRWLCHIVRQRHTAPSLYVRALVASIDTILTEYLDLLVLIESDALQHPGEVTIAHIQARIRSFDVVFSVLRTVIETIDNKALVGGQVLNLLHKHSNTGMPDVKLRLTQLSNHVLRVFYSQLVSWVSHGVLIDDHNEFMITQRIDNFEGGGANSSSGGSSNSGHSGHSGHSGSGSRRRNNNNKNNAYSSSSSIEDPHLLTREYNPVDAEHEWNTKYTLRLSMVPTEYVRYSFAQKALFVGKAMMVLKQLDMRSVQEKDKKKHQDQDQEQKTDQKPDQKPEQKLHTTEELSSLFANSIDTLRTASEFPSQPLEAALEQARIFVNQRLWWLTVRVSNLPKHLEAIKNYFLMWRGEFYQRFMVESFDLLALASPTSRTEMDLNMGPLQRAAATVGIDNDSYFNRFSLRLYSSTFTFQDFRLPSTHRLTSLGDVATGSNSSSGSGGRYGRYGGSGGSTSEGISNTESLSLVGGAISKQQRQQGSGTRRESRKEKGKGGERSSDKKAGALWHTELMVVEYGFDTIVHVKICPSSAISFIVQTDRLAAMSTTPSLLENSLVVTCSLSSDSTSIITKVTIRSKNKSKENETIVVSETVTAVSDITINNETNNEMNDETNNETNETNGTMNVRLRVVHRRTTAEQLEDTCQVYVLIGNSEQVSNIEWIPTKNERNPIVEFPLQLRKELVLSPTANGGGAWVGLIGTSQIINVQQQNNNVIVCGWVFDAKQKYIYTNQMNRMHSMTSSTSSTSTSKSAASILSSPSPSLSKERKRQDVGSCLEGTYRVGWPIHLIITQSALSQYNAIFQFLFSVGRVSSLLRGTWAVLMESKAQTQCAMHASRLRSRMAFFVDTLQYYFHVDVIAAQWHRLSEILKDTETTRDFEQVQTGHATFLASVSRQCLLHVRTVRDALDEVLDTCSELCTCVNNNVDSLEEEYEKIIEIDTKFTRCSSYLFLVLSGISEKLLLRLDFNAHYSSKASELGGAVGMP